MIFKIIIIVLFTTSIYASSISYEKILEYALEHDIEGKILKTKAKILQSDIDILKSDYYPQINLSVNTQYTKDLQKQSSVLNTILYDKTLYTSSSTLRFDYEVYDFSIKNKKLAISKIDKNIIKYDLLENKQKLQLKLLNIYKEILKDKLKLAFNKKINNINKEIFTYKKRLYESGQADKLNMSSKAIDVVDLGIKINNIKVNLQNNIDLIYYYTNHKYDIDTKFELFNISRNSNIDYNDSFIKKRLDLLIIQKYKELELLKSELYPVIKFYASYNIYDENKNELVKSFDLKEKNYILGFEVKINLFEGFKYKALRNKLKYQLEELKLQNQNYKRLHVKNKQLLANNLLDINHNISKVKISNSKNTNKHNMFEKMYVSDNIDKVSLLENKILLINKNLEYKLSIIENNIKSKEMNILGVNVVNGYKLTNSKIIIPKNIFNKYIIVSKTANVRNSPYLTGDIVRILKYKDIINVQYCNMYGWCKIEAKNEMYIANFLIRNVNK